MAIITPLDIYEATEKIPDSIITNLASTSTDLFDGADALTPGVSGTLPIAKGGTGATSAANARTNLGAYSSSGGTISGNATISGNGTITGNLSVSGSTTSAGVTSSGAIITTSGVDVKGNTINN